MEPDESTSDQDGGVVIEHHGEYSACCKWSIKLKQRATRCLWSKYFEVGGYDCRLLVYPGGAVLGSWRSRKFHIQAWLQELCVLAHR